MTATPLHLILFSRAPVAGATKSRLAATVGAEAAQAFHVACLLDILDEALAWQSKVAPEVAVHLHGFITPPVSQEDFERAGVRWPPSFRLHDQEGPALGDRMHGALDSVLGAEPGRALLFGTDLPLLRWEGFSEAFAALEAADVVFGPTPDGGYYLVGMRRPQRELFVRPTWGGSSVLRDSRDAAAALGLRTQALPVLPDVDVAEDIAAVLAHSSAAALAHRRAVRLLRRWVAEGRVAVAALSPRAGG